MTILSDRTILQRLEEDLVIYPINTNDIQPCSVDLHLSEDLKDLHDNTYNLKYCDYKLGPGEFILASTLEHVEIPDDLVGIVEGKSSIGRLGITAHVTAGYIDAGFKGNITLEIANLSDKPFTLQYNMSICQIIFETLTTPVQRRYGAAGLNSHYTDKYSKGTIPSRRQTEW